MSGGKDVMDGYKSQSDAGQSICKCRVGANDVVDSCIWTLTLDFLEQLIGEHNSQREKNSLKTF